MGENDIVNAQRVADELVNKAIRNVKINSFAGTGGPLITADRLRLVARLRTIANANLEVPVGGHAGHIDSWRDRHARRSRPARSGYQGGLQVTPPKAQIVSELLTTEEK